MASAGLALLVVCTGCFMLFTFTLAAQGEMEATVLGSDWRVWQLQERGTSGIGISQTSTRATTSSEPCRETRIWLIIWRPALKIESIVDRENCAARSPVLPPRSAADTGKSRREARAAAGVLAGRPAHDREIFA